MDKQKRYKQLKYIGGGEFGSVYLVEDLHTHQKCAMKVTMLDISKGKKFIECNLTEMDTQKKLMQINPPYTNIAIDMYEDEEKVKSMYDNKLITKKKVVIILPYCNYSTLEKYSMSHSLLSEVETKKYTFQMLQSIAVCHSHNFIHRDLKLENVLLHEQNGTITSYICDFGSSKETDENAKTMIGTSKYMAPEIFSCFIAGKNFTSYNNKVDIWSFGVMIYKLLTGSYPFTDEQFSNVEKNDITVPPQRLLSKAATSFLECCLQLDPKRRYSAQDLLNHEFITCATIPWYYFSWLEDNKEAIIINVNSYKNTESMLKIKEEAMRSIPPSSLSICEYLQNKYK